MPAYGVDCNFGKMADWCNTKHFLWLFVYTTASLAQCINKLPKKYGGGFDQHNDCLYTFSWHTIRMEFPWNAPWSFVCNFCEENVSVRLDSTANMKSICFFP